MTYSEKIFDISTGEEIFRPFNAEESAQMEQAAKQAEQEYLQTQQKAAAKAEARGAILERLGITEEEAKLLLG